MEEPVSSLLSQLPVVIVWATLPVKKSKFGATLDEAGGAVLPILNVLAIAAFDLKPPVPVAVNPVAVLILIPLPADVEVRVIKLAPKLIERVAERFELNCPQVISKPFKFIVPFSKPNIFAAFIANELPNDHSPPTPLKTTVLNAAPLEVTVLPVVVETKVTMPEPENTVEERVDKLPLMFKSWLLENVTVPAETVKFKQLTVATVIVTV